MASAFYDCLTAVRDRIRSLNLTAISDDDVRVRKLPYGRGFDVDKPLIAVCPINEEFNLGATNERDDIGYGVAIVMLQPSNQDLESHIDRILQWRESIRKSFSCDNVNDLTGAPDSLYVVRLMPGAVFDKAAFDNQFDQSVLVLRLTSRETRT